MGIILETNELTKTYGKKNALNGLNLKLESGKIIGLLGPNGSGKTTLMKIIAGFLKPSSGQILVDGSEIGIHSKAVVSFLPDVSPVYKWMTIDRCVKLYKEMFEDFDEKKAYSLLDFMKLNKTDKVKTLSKGMNEKLTLTLTLSRNARLYVLDEPLGGVDPVARESIIDAIVNNYGEDSTILISTHLVKDVERLFDEVVFLKDGQLALQGNAEDLRLEREKSIDDLFKEVFKDV